MKVSHILGVFVALVWPSLYGSVMSANCYVLQNNTNFTQTWHFQYNTPIGQGQLTQLAMQPHGHYPTNGQWCWNGTGAFHATVLVDPGAYRVSWNGPFVMGDGSGVSPGGTYSLNPPAPPPPPSPIADGSLIKSAAHPEVYFVQGKMRHHIPDPCTLQKRWSWSQVKTLPQNVVDSIPLGPAVPKAPGC